MIVVTVTMFLQHNAVLRKWKGQPCAVLKVIASDPFLDPKDKAKYKLPDPCVYLISGDEKTMETMLKCHKGDFITATGTLFFHPYKTKGKKSPFGIKAYVTTTNIEWLSNSSVQTLAKRKSDSNTQKTLVDVFTELDDPLGETGEMKI